MFHQLVIIYSVNIRKFNVYLLAAIISQNCITEYDL